LEEMSHGIALVATQLIRLVEGFLDGVLQSRQNSTKAQTFESSIERCGSKELIEQ
jgi:hypothetical protein